MNKSGRATAIGLLSLLFFFEAVGAIFIFWVYKIYPDTFSNLALFALLFVFIPLIVFIAFSKRIYFLDKCTIIMLIFAIRLICYQFADNLSSFMVVPPAYSILLLIFHIIMVCLAKSRKKRQGYIDRTIPALVFPITWLLGILTLVLYFYVLEHEVSDVGVCFILSILIYVNLTCYAVLARRNKEKTRRRNEGSGTTIGNRAQKSEAQRKEINESEHEHE